MISQPRSGGPRSIERALPMGLALLHEAVMRQFRPALSAADISEQQWRILHALSAMTRVQIRDLAQASCLPPAKLSRILKGLDDLGLTERQRSGRDMRLKLVGISPKGVLLIEKLQPLTEAISAEIADCCGASRIDALMTLLGEITAKLDERGPVAFDKTRRWPEYEVDLE